MNDVLFHNQNSRPTSEADEKSITALDFIYFELIKGDEIPRVRYVLNFE